jgi:hypothetical protein
MFNGHLKDVLAIAVLTISALNGQSAIAADGKVFSGAMCQPVLGNGSHAGGTILNDSTTGSLTVECPVVRDIVSGDIQEGQIRVYQAGGITQCVLQVKSYFGGAGIQQFVSTANGTGYRTLQFDAMSGSNNRPFYYWCALPPSASSSFNDQSRLIGYRVTEE